MIGTGWQSCRKHDSAINGHRSLSLGSAHGVLALPALPQTLQVVAMYDNDEYVTEAVRAGAAGYLIKDSAVEELALALQAVARGDHYLSPSISRKLAAAFSGGARHGPGLTGRQTEILRLVAQGRSSKEIARLLDLSIKTVETHRAQIMERLDIHDVPGLVRYAIRCGVISADS